MVYATRNELLSHRVKPGAVLSSFPSSSSTFLLLLPSFLLPFLVLFLQLKSNIVIPDN